MFVGFIAFVALEGDSTNSINAMNAINSRAERGYMVNLRELAKKQDIFTPGHRLCAGCGAGTIMRSVTLAADLPLVVSSATGCVEVSSVLYPYSSWRCSFIHNAFENSAATMSGVETAHRALRKRGKLKDEFRFIAFGGDGGSYDIGLQSLSGAMERGHRMLYCCYNNEAYMNTGVQRSSATPKGAATTTSPAGKVNQGKKEFPKDLTAIMVAHRIPYVAQAAPSHWNDLITKVQKALAVDGPAFMNIISPCPLGWRHASELSMELSRLAVDTCAWPLYEVNSGAYTLTYTPKEKRPLVDWLKPQGRFKHLFEPQNKNILDELQAVVDRNWAELLKRCAPSAQEPS